MTIQNPQPGQRIHHWTIVSVAGRRVTAQCRCKTIRIVTLDALLDGTCSSCGCSTPSLQKLRAVREAKEEQKRQRERDWRPQR